MLCSVVRRPLPTANDDNAHGDARACRNPAENELKSRANELRVERREQREYDGESDQQDPQHAAPVRASKETTRHEQYGKAREIEHEAADLINDAPHRQRRTRTKRGVNGRAELRTRIEVLEEQGMRGNLREQQPVRERNDRHERRSKRDEVASRDHPGTPADEKPQCNPTKCGQEELGFSESCHAHTCTGRYEMPVTPPSRKCDESEAEEKDAQQPDDVVV